MGSDYVEGLSIIRSILRLIKYTSDAKKCLCLGVQVVPFIDGLNSVRRIAELADVDYQLVKKCIEHLLFV